MPASPRPAIDTLSVPNVCLSIAELQCWCGFGKTKIYEEIKVGRLQVLKCGTWTLFHPDDVRHWLTKLRTAAR